MSKGELRLAAQHEKPIVRRVWNALLVPLVGALSVMCADNGDGASGDGGAAGNALVDAGGASVDAGGASGSHSTSVGGAAGSQSIGGVTSTAGGPWGGQGGAAGGAPRCATTFPARCLATDDAAGGAAAGSLQNAVAELVGATSVNAVNNHNQLVGGQRCGGDVHAFMRDDSGVRDLLADEDDVLSVAHDINDGGMVVGEVGFEWLPSGTLSAIYPFIWQDGVTTVLRDLPGARAMAVNAHDQVLIAGENGSVGGFLWESGEVTHLGASLSASGINDLGQVVGTLYKGVGMQVGFIWADGVITELPLLRTASAINDSGQIAGISAEGTPVLVDGASIVELGPALGEPIAITADGTVLGSDYVYAGGVLTALSGRVGGHSFEEVAAHDINADHVIVGSGTVLTFTSGAGGCRLEFCEDWTDHAVVWKDECFAACCGEATGAGGAGGEAGAGGAPARVCDRIADLVPTTCPMGGPSGAYRETGLGLLEVSGSIPGEKPWAVSSARAINARGDVVGDATLCDTTRAILYRAGVLLDLDPVPGALSTFAWDINDEGDVLGESDGVTFVWKNGVTTALSGIGGGSGIAINNLGQVLGADQDGPYIWDAGLVTRLGLDRNITLTDLNDRGQVTGYNQYAELSAFVWEDGEITTLPPLPGDNYTTALAINEAGQVVGSSVQRVAQQPAAAHAVLWDSGVAFDITPPTDYPLVDSAGLDINESGVVLGSFQEDGPRQNSAAFVFDHGVTTRIFPEDPTVGAALSPSAINDAGEIAGTTLYWTGSPNQATVWSRDCFGACCRE